MNSRLITAIVGVVLISGVGFSVYTKKNSENTSVAAVASNKMPTQQTAPAAQQKSSAGITFAVVAQHNFRTSCWSVINESVYDLTSWIPNHPGGEQAILSLCGVDGTAGYTGQHGSRKKPAAILAGFKIGQLAP